jgi:hypothetical protein
MGLIVLKIIYNNLCYRETSSPDATVCFGLQGPVWLICYSLSSFLFLQGPIYIVKDLHGNSIKILFYSLSSFLFLYLNSWKTNFSAIFHLKIRKSSRPAKICEQAFDIRQQFALKSQWYSNPRTTTCFITCFGTPSLCSMRVNASFFDSADGFSCLKN